uniref:Ribosome production factor 2 homolog n=1 Tax=Phlebotomus papatasi TaxID=29031 RepID=A0A1B0CZU4_PHLPP
MLGLVKYRGLQEFKNEKISSNVKPCLVFNGPKWTQSEELRRLKCLLIDAFHREAVDSIRLQGMEHVLSFTLTDDLTVLMRSYRILLKKSGQRTPRIELTEIGPACDFVIRRTKIASEDLYKLSRKRPKQLKPLKKKNLSTDVFGNKQGQVHVGKQNIHKIQTRKVKALKKTAEERKAEKNKAETARSLVDGCRQVLLNREPKLIENVKNTLILEGRKCSGDIKSALKDLYHLKKPQAKCLSRQNEITPFDDEIPLLQLAQKNECSLFMFGSTSKKRPNNLILGRLYEQELLDMVDPSLDPRFSRFVKFAVSLTF